MLPIQPSDVITVFKRLHHIHLLRKIREETSAALSMIPSLDLHVSRTLSGMKKWKMNALRTV